MVNTFLFIGGFVLGWIAHLAWYRTRLHYLEDVGAALACDSNREDD